MKIETKYDIYDLLKEKVTGFEGVVMGITQYATGCTHYGLVSRELGDNGKPKNWEWFDETRLELTKSNVLDNDSKKRTSGPDMNPKCH